MLRLNAESLVHIPYSIHGKYFCKIYCVHGLWIASDLRFFTTEKKNRIFINLFREMISSSQESRFSEWPWWINLISILNRIYLDFSCIGICIQKRLKQGTPSCSEGSFSVSLGLEEKDPSDPSNLIAFTPNGYLQVGLDYYSPQEYCIDS